MKIGIGIFAKTIGLSRVKTRLAEGMGQKLAEEFYILSVKAVEEVVTNYSKTSNDEIVIYWARPSGKYDISTRGLGLGTAMYKVANHILKECDAYIIIGTDTPQISEKTFYTAINSIIDNHEIIVFGPSLDGGFYLMASTKVPSKLILDSVSYSQGDTLEQLLELLKAEGNEFAFIKELSDVDIVEDLKHLRKYLEDRKGNNDILLESQESILDWLKKRKLP